MNAHARCDIALNVAPCSDTLTCHFFSLEVSCHFYPQFLDSNNSSLQLPLRRWTSTFATPMRPQSAPCGATPPPARATATSSPFVTVTEFSRGTRQRSVRVPSVKGHHLCHRRGYRGYQGGGSQHEGVHIQRAGTWEAVQHHRGDQERESERLCVGGGQNR